MTAIINNEGKSVRRTPNQSTSLPKAGWTAALIKVSREIDSVMSERLQPKFNSKSLIINAKLAYTSGPALPNIPTKQARMIGKPKTGF